MDRETSPRGLGEALLDEAENNNPDSQVLRAPSYPPPQAPEVARRPELVARRQIVGGLDGRKERCTSVTQILRQMAEGDVLRARGEHWKLTRAFVHLEDSWKGRVSPCPSLDNERVRKLFKLRWHLRYLDFMLVHMLMVLSLLETPSWCVGNGKCFWHCYPDFSRNWHLANGMDTAAEALMLLPLVAIALLDMHIQGRHYWAWSDQGVRGVPLTMRLKHCTLALYVTAVILSRVLAGVIHMVAGYCRVLLYLSVHRRTLLVVTQLRYILGAVLEIWALIFINVLLFAWMGVVLFTETREGETFFPDIFEGAWGLFVLFTTTNFPDIMMSALDDVRASLIYFLGFVILNVFFLAPLSLAFIFNVFRGGQKGIPRLEEDIRIKSTTAAFGLLDHRRTGYVDMATFGSFLLEVHGLRGVACRELARLQDLIREMQTRRPDQPGLGLQEYKDAVRIMDRGLDHAEWITEAQWYMPRLYNSPTFRFLTRTVKHRRMTLWPGFAGTPHVSVLLLDFLEALMLLISFVALILATGGSDWTRARLDWMQTGVVFGFCITTFLNALVRGWHNCVRYPTFVFNLVLSTFSALVIGLTFCQLGRNWGWRVMRALRVLHLGLLVSFAPRLAFLSRTLLIMTKRAAIPASLLLAWGFFMAVLGVQLFGGLVCVPELGTTEQNCDGAAVERNDYTESGLSLLNFNDIPTSFVTLFVLIVVNDWFEIVDEFVDITGNGWARTFFIVNYIIGVAVILNLVVTMVINSFWDEFKRTVKRSSAVRNIHEAAAASAHPGLRVSASPAISGTIAESGGMPNLRRDSLLSSHSSGSRSRGSDLNEVDENEWTWARLVIGDEGGRCSGGVRVTTAGDDSASSTPMAAATSSTGTESANEETSSFGSGDQEGMDAERAMNTRASNRRLGLSGIT